MLWWRMFAARVLKGFMFPAAALPLHCASATRCRKRENQTCLGCADISGSKVFWIYLHLQSLSVQVSTSHGIAKVKRSGIMENAAPQVLRDARSIKHLLCLEMFKLVQSLACTQMCIGRPASFEVGPTSADGCGKLAKTSQPRWAEHGLHRAELSRHRADTGRSRFRTKWGQKQEEGCSVLGPPAIARPPPQPALGAAKKLCVGPPGGKKNGDRPRRTWG